MTPENFTLIAIIVFAALGFLDAMLTRDIRRDLLELHRSLDRIERNLVDTEDEAP